MTFEFVEVESLSQKRKWYERFCKDYDELSRPFDKRIIVDDARFFVAKVSNRELGYIRIDDKSSYFDCEVWNITEAFIKPMYRGNGILREMINHVVKHCRVQMMHISSTRYAAHRVYYQSLGFSGECSGFEAGLGWVFRFDFDVEGHSVFPDVENGSEQEGATSAA